ncbi:MAG: carbohydrate ABC transporter permease [Candidatus Micrarchaeaceae archaeon]
MATVKTVRLNKWSIPAFVILIIWAILSFVPIFWMLVAAFTPSTFLLQVPPKISLQNFGLENFQRLFSQETIQNQIYLGQWFLNTLIVSGSVTIFNVFFDMLAGFAFARRNFPGRDILFIILMSSVMIPGMVTMLPLFSMIVSLHLYNTLWAIILPNLSSPFGIFLMRQYIRSLPDSLEDAAKIDGASEFLIFFRIILPLSIPIMAVWAIFTFMAQWNNFLWPLIVINSPSKYLLQVGLSTFQTKFSTDYGLTMAGTALSAAPMVAFFFIFQKYLNQGITMGDIQ